MLQAFRNILTHWLAGRYKQKVKRALDLHRRGEARRDGLHLRQAQSRLEIEWSARDIHPWDGDRAPEEQALLFVNQALADADAALSRLFALLHHIDSVTVSVLDPQSDHTIMVGTVFRSSLDAPRPLSNRMWLGQLGIQFRLTGNHFEPLEFGSGTVSRTA